MRLSRQLVASMALTLSVGLAVGVWLPAGLLGSGNLVRMVQRVPTEEEEGGKHVEVRLLTQSHRQSPLRTPNRAVIQSISYIAWCQPSFSAHDHEPFVVRGPFLSQSLLRPLRC